MSDKQKVSYYLTRKNREFVDKKSKSIGLTKSGYMNLLINTVNE